MRGFTNTSRTLTMLGLAVVAIPLGIVLGSYGPSRGQDAGDPRFAGTAAAQFQCLLHGIGPLADANGKHCAHPLPPCPLQQLLPIGVIPRAVKMCM